MRTKILACIITLAAICGCKKPAATSCQGCPATVSFKADIIPIFRVNCAIPGCHTGTAATADHFVLDSAVAYMQATEPGTGYVVAGNPGYSILYSQLLVGAQNHMPQNGVQLDNCDIQKIYCWIEQGALDN